MVDSLLTGRLTIVIGFSLNDISRLISTSGRLKSSRTAVLHPAHLAQALIPA